jgi:hypothetical protein
MTSKTVIDLVSTCAVCGAEESLDALIFNMIDDDNVRRLIADVLMKSLPLGGLVVRYLRLHKPAKQKLRMDKVAKVLGELLADMQRNCIERKGREWRIDTEGWKLALEAVFTAQTKGTITLPLDGNAYLYEVVMRLSDKAEGEAEKATQSSSRGRSYQAGAQSIGELAAAATTPSLRATPSNEGELDSPSVTKGCPAGGVAPRVRTESPAVKAMKAEIAAKLALRAKQPEADLDDPEVISRIATLGIANYD